MHLLETQIEISATAERVWSVLTNFSAYADWNPMVRSIEGSLEVGKPLNVLIHPEGSKAMRFTPTLLAVIPNVEFRWKGKFLLPGLFDGNHYFKIENKPEGGVIFHQGEIFTGILVPLFKSSLGGSIKQGFIATNEAIKRESEKV